jgi:hypothetical protein
VLLKPCPQIIDDADVSVPCRPLASKNSGASRYGPKPAPGR